ncbi:hypothetical protein LZZ85_20675 [Terrimonas sp. NA20]|uniref:YceI family protein n=1 Tax=Terrimonas ginsenosidimutans TaxID=2908004 RepID=A0ABS9KWN2_9BACT|nr:hypothetical protein [Terrimonas ginsenosidimutans]MCG2616726.1 hypothetical protein [Terrimonas ginsenosidimutans]
MVSRIITAALLTATLVSCKTDKEEIIIPPATLEMTRTITLPFQNNLRKTASYSQTSGLVSYATLENDLLSLSFVAEPAADRSMADGITFQLHTKHLASPVKTYSFSDPANKIEHARYTFSDHQQATRIRIIDTKMGSSFTGRLTITAYDPANHLISGYYSIEIPDLIYDPSNLQAGVPGDPKDQSYLQLTGSFENVRIK